MITSWNVNRFWKADKWYNSDFYVSSKEKTEQRWTDEYLEPVFNRIAEYLQNEDDILILQEVPYMLYDPDKKGRSKFVDVCSVRERLQAFCNKKSFRILSPLFSPDAYAQTVAIFKEGNYVYDEYYSKNVESKFPSYRNKIVAVHKADDPKFVVVGVHIPDKNSGGTEFYDSLIRLHHKMPDTPYDIPIIYVGDFNTYIPGTVNKCKLYGFMSEGLADFWLEKGNSHNKATFNANTRIDYILVTDKDYSALADKYDMEVDDLTREGENALSDHSAIILKERTPETKKTGELK